MVNFGPLMAEIRSGVWGTQQISTGFASIGRVTARHSSSGRQPNFAALNRWRHQYSAGRPLGIGPRSSSFSVGIFYWHVVHYQFAVLRDYFSAFMMQITCHTLAPYIEMSP